MVPPHWTNTVTLCARRSPAEAADGASGVTTRPATLRLAVAIPGRIRPPDRLPVRVIGHDHVHPRAVDPHLLQLFGDFGRRTPA
ncbi:hypothetical protein [Streptomyces sp. MUM 2J]|uniref:hypothetical protein n=1 Tax=Streptomyces sp. MUM 2J TaxID=2791987 RepID=UPI001F03E3A7|nr:hypothetical protein [Streptomyces sp. MUM 2J]MCH0567039.1 hypothetical protein [Streptomyces sp. MUM 2J]